MNVLSGIQPTGRFHWGNYFGAVAQYIALQDEADRAFYFIADLHALTTVRGEADTLRQNTRDAVLDLLALGLDPDKATLFRQSDVPEVTELFWLLLSITQMHLLDKGHSYKDKKDRGLPADAGLYTYPILQAADILLYDSDTVPVGADQVQHIEITRDLAQRFNNIYGGPGCGEEGGPPPLLVPPAARVLDASAKVVGTDGEKMSKSYGNAIEIFLEPKKLRKKIMGIKTDSTPVEDAKDPETCSVVTLYKLFATAEEAETLAGRYRAGGIGYGESKQLLFEAADRFFGPARERRADLEQAPDIVDRVLAAGAATARAKGAEVMDRVRTAAGIGTPA